MPRASKVCPCTGCSAHRGSCPGIVSAGTSRCAPCSRSAEQARGSRQERGYDAEHDRLRASWAPRVATGKVTCSRCGERIRPGQKWDLGHDDNDRRRHSGPEHASCNRSAGGRASHAGRRRT